MARKKNMGTPLAERPSGSMRSRPSRMRVGNLPVDDQNVANALGDNESEKENTTAETVVNGRDEDVDREDVEGDKSSQEDQPPSNAGQGVASLPQKHKKKKRVERVDDDVGSTVRTAVKLDVKKEKFARVKFVNDVNVDDQVVNVLVGTLNLKDRYVPQYFPNAEQEWKKEVTRRRCY